MRFLGAVTLHLFEDPVGPKTEVNVSPMIHVEKRADLVKVARALREVADSLEADASPILRPTLGIAS